MGLGAVGAANTAVRTESGVTKAFKKGSLDCIWEGNFTVRLPVVLSFIY